MESQERKLDRLTIQIREYWENKGKYEWNIEFKNWDNESFKFKLRPDIATRYISLIADDVVISATDLWDRLLQSLTDQWMIPPK